MTITYRTRGTDGNSRFYHASQTIDTEKAPNRCHDRWSGHTTFHIRTNKHTHTHTYLDGGAITLDLHLLERDGTVLVGLRVFLEQRHVAQGSAPSEALEARVALVVGVVTLGEGRSAVL